MLTFIELLIGVVVIVGVARYIIKGYSATGVLFVGGLLLLIISAIMGHKVLPSSQASTGYSATDIVEYVKILLMSRGGDLGMMIMMLCGFAAYMTHIGANDMVVKLASKPLQYINSPYLLMIAAYFVACLMSLAVSSATGLGVFADGNPISGDGKRWYQSWRSCCHLCLPGGDYSRTDFRGCGAGGASFRNVAD
ncbi:C4-dicarboxylate transporter DcuC [Escherichia coli]|nr:C4-dicarboxylate transporter DcuC [Escherichia coli]